MLDARREGVGRAALDILVGVVGSRRERDAEAGDLGGGIHEVEEIIGTAGPDHGRRPVLAVVHDFDRLVMQDGLDVHRRLDLEEVVPALRNAADHAFGVDQVPAELPDAVEVALRRVLDDEAGVLVLE